MKSEFLKEFLKDTEVETISIGCSSARVSKIVKDNKTYFLKEDKVENLNRELFMLSKLKGKLPVPEIKFTTIEKNKMYLLTKKLKGEMVCEDDIFDDWKRVTELCAKALKMLQSIDINDIALMNNIDIKLQIAKNVVESGKLTLDDLSDKYKSEFKDQKEIYDYLVKNKPQEKLCFSHGDLSLPNIYYKGNEITGFLDLGDAGIADYWYDIAILIKSIRRNYDNSDEIEEYLFKLLDIKPDYKKIDYYILLTECFL